MTVHCFYPESSGTWLSINGGIYTEYPCGVDIVVTQIPQTAYLFAWHTRAPFKPGGCSNIQNELAYITVGANGRFGYASIYYSSEPSALSIDTMLERAGTIPDIAYLPVAVTLTTTLLFTFNGCGRTLTYTNVYANGQFVEELGYSETYTNGVMQTLTKQKQFWDVEVLAA